MRITNGLGLVSATALLAACGGAQDSGDASEAQAAADKTPAAVASTLECEALGDAAVSIETTEDGAHTLVTVIQSEMAPDAEPIRFELEPTGASAGREGTRLSDINGEFTVWMMDDGSATVKSGEIEVGCKG